MDRRGPASVAIYHTGQLLQEQHHAISELARGVLARRERGGCTLVVLAPRATQFAQRADIFLPIRPGTDVALLNAMQHTSSATTLWPMGVNQSHAGTAAVNQIGNLHLITAQIGRPGAGPFSLTGQPSSMDFRRAGGGPFVPGYRSLANDIHRAQIAAA